MTNYTITDEAKTVKGKTVYRIIAADGRNGGFIESEANLSKDGECFIHGDSVVMDQAVILDDAQVFGLVRNNARIQNFAEVYGEVYDDAIVRDHAKVYGRLGGSTVVGEHEIIYGDH